MSLGLAACGDGRTAGSASVSQAVPSGGMTYRTNPTTGDKVSLLGYGCMRWPSVGGRSAREGNEEIDQEMVNRLVDFAIEHGVNYFDTSPAYCRGTSERATGIALSRHPREKCLIATKMMQFDTIPCNDCKYCMPCPYGLDIPAILLHYNKCLNEGNIPESSTDPEYRKARRAYLVGYDRSVPRLRQASHCIGCGQCSPHCPQRIDIPAELHRIDAYVERLRQNTL